MTLDVDVFWSFRSPYSYLATPRLGEIAARYDVNIHVRPVYPLAVRSEGFFTKQDPLFAPLGTLWEQSEIDSHKKGIRTSWTRSESRPLPWPRTTRAPAA